MLVESFLIGLVIGFIIYELYGVSPGGIITPAYLAINIRYPQNIISTLLLAILVFYILKFAASYLIIFGKRRLLLAILIGFLCKLIVDAYLIKIIPAHFDLHTIGYVIPGLIANEYYRQGIGKTLISIIVASLLTAIVLMVIFL